MKQGLGGALPFSTISTLTTESASHSDRAETSSEPSKSEDLPSVRAGGAAEMRGAGDAAKKSATRIEMPATYLH